MQAYRKKEGEIRTISALFLVTKDFKGKTAVVRPDALSPNIQT